MADAFPLGTVMLGFSAVHANRGKLSVELTGPDGTKVTAVATSSDTNAGYDMLLADEHGAALAGMQGDHDPAAPPFERLLRPSSPLRAFQGKTSNGTWTLRACDTTTGGTAGSAYVRSRLVLAPRDVASKAGRWSYKAPNVGALDYVQRSLSVYAQDAAGNRTVTPVQLNVWVDNVAPTLAVSNTLSTVTLGSTAKVLEGAAKDGGPRVDVTIQVTAPDGTRSVVAAARNGTTWWLDLGTTLPGAYTLYAIATDAAGNRTMAGPYVVQASCTAAQLTATLTSAEPSATSPKTITLNATITNKGSAVVAAGLPMKFSVDGVVLGAALTTAQIGLNQSTTVSIAWPVESPGTRTITVAPAPSEMTPPLGLCTPSVAARRTLSTADVLLRPGLNLVSFPVNPVVQTVTTVQRPISGTYSVIQSYDLGWQSYYPAVPPPEPNTLTKMDAEHGYWIRANDGISPTLRVVGDEYAYNQAIALDSGWNLVSYLPQSSLPVTVALSGIAGKYKAVHGFDGVAMSYYPDLDPAFNTLTVMQPLHGYWLQTTQAVTLKYVGTTGAMAALASGSFKALLNPPQRQESGAAPVTTPAQPEQGGEAPAVTKPDRSEQSGEAPVITRPGQPEQSDEVPMAPEPIQSEQGGEAPMVIAPAQPEQGGEALTMAALVQPAVLGKVSPSQQWVNLYSATSTIDGQPMPAGIIVGVYAAGVQCGQFVTKSTGRYGLVPCYRDDPTTIQVEGAKPGDLLTFTTNGSPAVAVARSLNGAAVAATTPITWSQNLDRWEVDLSVATTAQTGPAFIANSPAYTNDHACTNLHCTLSEAVEAANKDGQASTIELINGMVYTLKDAGLPSIGSPITINGSGAIIERSAESTAEIRPFTVDYMGDLTLNQLTVRGFILTGTNKGAGIYTNGTVSLNGCTFYDNKAYYGGAINMNAGKVTVVNSTFYNNVAAAYGGAIMNYGDLTILNSTIVKPSTTGHAIYTYTGRVLTLKNTLLVRGASGANCSGLAAAAGSVGNMADDASCGTSVTVKTAAEINLGALASNGGPTQTAALPAGSSAIDAADGLTCLDSLINGVDQRGYKRFFDGNGDGIGRCDVGAFEYGSNNLPPIAQTGPIFTVNSTSYTTDNACTDVHCTLRDAVEAANKDGKDSIIELTAGAAYALQENAGSNAGVVDITTPIKINAHGATIRRGSATGIPPNIRAFVVRPGGALTLTQATISGFGVGAGEYGGAIWTVGPVTISGCTVTGNSAQRGGAFFNAGGATMTIVNSTVYTNTATELGGIAYNQGTLTVLNSTFAGNSSPSYGALVNYSGATMILKNALLVKGASGANCNGAIAAVSVSNMADDASCGTSTKVFTAAEIALAALASNGGPTQTMALGSTSVAIDMGNATACQDSLLKGRDQRGYDRFADGPDTDTITQCDIGAFEYGASELPYLPPAPDTTPPQVRVIFAPTAPDGNNGWYRSAVTPTVQFRDPSPVIEVRCALNPASPPTAYTDLPEENCPFMGGVPVTADGLHTIYVAAMDLFNNQSTPISGSFRLDATPPVIPCPQAGPFLQHSGEHTVTVNPADVDAAISGLDEAASTLSGVVTTETVGTHTVTFTAFDLAGNSRSQECAYSVIFNFGGFYPPVEPAPALNKAKAGSVTPLKFSLGGDHGLDIFAEGYPASQQVACDTLTPTGPLETAEPPGKNGLSYDPASALYSINWKTDRAWSGTCRALILRFVEGSEQRAYFHFK